jgi:cyclophilin family peptidyl-prolyl cis-trans isomerase/HEAT repeat protein
MLSIASVTPVTLRAQVKFSADERRIITITDERRDADSLLRYLTSSTIKVARRAAIDIGNIGDTSVRPALLKCFLVEQRDSVGDAEAFGLGLLGSDEKTYLALTESVAKRATTERLIAIARTATKADSASAAKIVGQLADQKKIDPLTEADAYLEFALHHQVSSRMMNDLNILANDNDPKVRWRAACAFARAGDSLDLASMFPKLKDLLLDQGSPYVRMFGALALGKLHDARADTALYRAYRGEEDWRVRVNILRAFGQFKSLDSLTLSTFQLAGEGALRDSTIAIEVGLAAGDAIETLVTSGCLLHADSSALRDWLNGFNGGEGQHDEIEPMVGARLTIPAVRLETPTLYDAVKDYALYRDPIIRNYAVRAAATRADTNFFSSIVGTMSAFGPIEQVVRIEALDSLWGFAKRIPAFRKALEANRMADLYRGLLIHISDAVTDPAVAAISLGSLRDTTIIRDSAHRVDARQQVEKYIPMFSNGHFRDALLAAVEDDAWLGDTSLMADRALRLAYDTANSWGDNELLDSITSLLKIIDGRNAILPKRIPRVSHIDWMALESLPPNMVINFSTGSIILRLLTEETPLTVLNMVRLAQDQWFAGNIIHRVVPNFVIQSGDPSGTGWEGPGYMIRSEITPREYEREGMVGMASDGKDTESSQWFITECPTPHLDARYTIWAVVTDGMDEVGKRKVGDKLNSFNPFR